MTLACQHWQAPAAMQLPTYGVDAAGAAAGAAPPLDGGLPMTPRGDADPKSLAAGSNSLPRDIRNQEPKSAAFRLGMDGDTHDVPTWDLRQASSGLSAPAHFTLPFVPFATSCSFPLPFSFSSLL